MDLLHARLTAEAASVDLAVAARNQEIRNAANNGMTVRAIEAATGVPRSTVHRITTAKPLTDAQYLALSNTVVRARAEVAAIESVQTTLDDTQRATDVP